MQVEARYLAKEVNERIRKAKAGEAALVEKWRKAEF